MQDECHGASQALAALEFVAPLPVRGWGDTYVHYIVAWRLIVCRSVRYLLLRHDAVDFCRVKFKKEKHSNVAHLFKLLKGGLIFQHM